MHDDTHDETVAEYPAQYEVDAVHPTEAGAQRYVDEAAKRMPAREPTLREQQLSILNDLVRKLERLSEADTEPGLLIKHAQFVVLQAQHVEALLDIEAVARRYNR